MLERGHILPLQSAIFSLSEGPRMVLRWRCYRDE
jgi:hypothetical protein